MAQSTVYSLTVYRRQHGGDLCITAWTANFSGTARSHGMFPWAQDYRLAKLPLEFRPLAASRGPHGQAFRSEQLWRPSQPRGISDAVPMDALSQRCKDALQVLFEGHSPLVVRIARRILRDDEEVEETVQRISWDVFKAANQFIPDHGSFKKWPRQYGNHRSIDRRGHLQANEFYKSSCWTSPASACRLQGRALTKRQLLNRKSSAGVS